MFEELLGAAPYSIRQAHKDAAILEGLNGLVSYHYERCLPYRRIIDAAWGGLRQYDRLQDVPYLPVSVFKGLELSSTEQQSMVMYSSGTTGQVPSKIIVDPETATRQSRALIATFKPVLGERRIPFLVFDTKDVIKATGLTARGAGVLGMMKFGARTTFALDPDLEVDRDLVKNFLAKNGHEPFLIFGFTFLVWTKLYKAFDDGELDLSNAILIHSGGWKKLESERVSNEEFRRRMGERFGLTRIFNFYGFVEQIGSMFLEGPNGLLYPPNFTDVIVRRESDFQPAEVGEEGIIEVVSLLPLSYPGHALLTEDRGVVEMSDSAAGVGQIKGIRVLGRVAKAELRGCSDVIAAQAA